MRNSVFLLPVLAALLPATALAQGHAVTVVNRSGDTIRRIQISPAGNASAGENRLRSQLPPNAEARIGYSSGCRADIRIGFDGNRTEQFLDQDTCADLHITAGKGIAGPDSAAASPVAATGTPAASHTAAEPHGRKGHHAVATKPDLVVVPPWTGRSITKRFGGMD